MRDAPLLRSPKRRELTHARPWSAAITASSSMLSRATRRDSILLVSLLTVIVFFLTRLLQTPTREVDTRSSGVVTVTTRTLSKRQPAGEQQHPSDTREGGSRGRVPDLFSVESLPTKDSQRPGVKSADGTLQGLPLSALGSRARKGGADVPFSSSSRKVSTRAASDGSVPTFAAGAGGGGGGTSGSNSSGSRGGAGGGSSSDGSGGGARGPGGTAGVPPDFSWRTYLLYHPELAEQGITSEALAREHYARRGRAEGRVYRRLRVIVRYTACTGLINQHYSHLAALSLCAVLGAELVLAPAVKRDSFAHYFSVFKDQNEVVWTPAELDTLLDVDALVAFWAQRGLTIHRTPALLPFPDLTQPEVAFPQYPQPELDPRFITRLEHLYLQSLDLGELVEAARAAVVGHAGTLLRGESGPPVDPDYIVLDLPCTFFMLRSLSNLRVVAEVARSLVFAPAVQALADRVIAGMTQGGQAEYNAVHLRIEKDARDWSIIMGGEQVVWHNYLQAMRAAGFSRDAGLYVASGLLTYGASEEMEHITAVLKEFGLCSDVHYKERYLPQEEVEELNSEQKALVDLLVLARGRGFVGFGSSTFSFFLREYRVLSGLPRASSVLVDASVIGTDPLFNAAGTIV